MNGHVYRYTIEYVEDPKGDPQEVSPLIFESRNHDNLFKVVELMKGKIDLEEGDDTQFTVGLKLLGEIMFKNKENELFSQFKPHFRDFMKELKKSN